MLGVLKRLVQPGINILLSFMAPRFIPHLNFILNNVLVTHSMQYYSECSWNFQASKRMQMIRMIYAFYFKYSEAIW